MSSRPGIKAIPTNYAGCAFRSRLEARWAVFFDTLGVRWEYEPQGFELPSGRYLPDFWLPEIGASGSWFEVKGVEPSERERALAHELARAGDCGAFIAHGQLPRVDTFDLSGHEYPGPGGFDIAAVAVGDFHYAWCICPWCGSAGLEFDARGARVHGWKRHKITEAEAISSAEAVGGWRIDDKCYTGNHPRILAAYARARAARFEHGQRP